MSKNAIVLGRYKRRIVADRTESNVAIIAPTRRGKGVSVVNPTALSWTGSMVINDTKYELWPITSGWRSLLGKVYRFAPTTPGVSCRLNPIGGIDPRLEASIAKVQSIAGALAEPYEVSGSSETAGHFRDHGETLLAGLILHGLTTGRGRSLGGINWMLNDPERPTEDLYEEMLKSSHPFVGMTARQQLDLADRERAGIVSSTRRFLRLWHDPVIQKLTDHHSFDYEDLRRGTVPVSLYLCVTLEERERLRGLFRLIVTQAIRQMVSSGLAPGHEVLMLLDEFPVLGKMRELEQSFSEVAGFGIRALII
jgi:type IV secretion system protein VirD4